MDKEGNISPLGKLLGELADSRQWRQRLALHAPFLRWEELVGVEIAAVTQPEVIREGVLWLRVADPVWRQQLVYQKSELLTAINKSLRSAEKLKDLRFRLDPGLEERLAAQKSAGEPAGARPTAIDPERQQRFVNLLSTLADPEARSTMLRLWRKAESAKSGDDSEPT